MKSILLVNLGTPAAPTAPAVREYLAEFLSDPRVVPLPRWLWLPLLHGVVLPLRAGQSAHKYAQIWTPAGSPLAVYTARMARRLAEHSHLPVSYAMRYGEPSIASALGRLERPVVVPLYPQYAESTTGSVHDVLPRGVPVSRGFHDDPAYIAALAASVRRHWAERGRGLMLLMSFHGLPQRYARDYQRECRTTAALLAHTLGLRDAEWRVTTKPGKLYFTFFSEPRAAGGFEIPAVTNRLTKAYLLADHTPIELKQNGGKTTFEMPRPMLDPMATVVVVEFEGTRVERR